MIKQCFVLQFYMNGKDNYTVVLSRALFRRYFRLVAILVGNERQSSRFSIWGIPCIIIVSYEINPLVSEVL